MGNGQLLLISNPENLVDWCIHLGGWVGGGGPEVIRIPAKMGGVPINQPAVDYLGLVLLLPKWDANHDDFIAGKGIHLVSKKVLQHKVFRKGSRAQAKARQHPGDLFLSPNLATLQRHQDVFQVCEDPAVRRSKPEPVAWKNPACPPNHRYKQETQTHAQP